MSRTLILYVASLSVHGALAAGVFMLKGGRAREATSISIVQSKREVKKVDPPKPAVVQEELPKVEAKVKRAPSAAPPKPMPAQAAAPAAVQAPLDFGLSLGGVASGGPGLVVAARSDVAASTPAVEKSKKVLAAIPAREETCSEPVKKPKVLAITQPSYTREAREAQIAGRVRVQITVAEDGSVSDVRVLEGLGYGLDEAALSAARSATFEAAAKCGNPVRATFVVSMRFSL